MLKKIKTAGKTILIAIAVIASIYELSREINLLKATERKNNLEEFVALAAGGFTAGNIDSGAPADHMYTFIPDGITFCGGHGWALTLRKKYANVDPVPDMGGAGRKQEITYQLYGPLANVPIVQSIAYAKAMGTDKDLNYLETLQNIVWASWQWEGDNGGHPLYQYEEGDAYTVNSDGLIGRSYQFANFAYRALSGGTTLGISCAPLADNDASLKVMVNQDDSSYTVGPYQISFPNMGNRVLDGSESIGMLVYKEITMQNPGETSANQFCSANINVNVSFQDGSVISKSNENKEIVILGENGQPIEGNFPRFGEPFYIKYYSSKDAEIVEMIKPSVQIQYMKKFNSYTHTYNSKSMKFKMFDDNYDIILDAADASNCEFHRSGDEIQIETMHALVLGDFESETYIGLLNDFFTGSVVSKVIEKLASGWHISNVSVTTEPDTPKDGYFFDGVFYDIDNVSTTVENSSTTLWECDTCGLHFTSEISALVHEYLNENHTTSSETEFYCKLTLQIANNTVTFTASSTTSDIDAENDARNQADAYLEVHHCRYGIAVTDVTVECDIDRIQPAVKLDLVVPSRGSESATLGGKEINMYIGGNVWQSLPSNKVTDYEEKYFKGRDADLGGIQVELWDNTKNYSASITRTDKQGEYGFKKINPLHKYKIIFMYDGMRFENTTYTNNLSGGYSTAKESNDDRNYFNDLYDKIDTSPQNYYKDNQWRKAYRSVFKNRR